MPSPTPENHLVGTPAPPGSRGAPGAAGREQDVPVGDANGFVTSRRAGSGRSRRCLDLAVLVEAAIHPPDGARRRSGLTAHLLCGSLGGILRNDCELISEDRSSDDATLQFGEGFSVCAMRVPPLIPTPSRGWSEFELVAGDLAEIAELDVR